jgi:hypothetical protein
LALIVKEKSSDLVENDEDLDPEHIDSDNLNGAKGVDVHINAEDAVNLAVASQLANVSAVVSNLASLLQSTRQEMKDMRAELAQCKAQTSSGVMNSSSGAGQGLGVTGQPGSNQGLAAASGVVSSGAQAFSQDVQGLIPTLADLRADSGLTAQGHKMVEEIHNSVQGNCQLVINNKRGMVRSGGDLAPSVKTPWPQDFVLGSG